MFRAGISYNGYFQGDVPENSNPAVLRTASLYAAVDTAEETEFSNAPSAWTPRIPAEKIVFASSFIDAYTCASLTPVRPDTPVYPNGAVVNMAGSCSGGNMSNNNVGNSGVGLLSPSAGTVPAYIAAYTTGASSMLTALGQHFMWHCTHTNTHTRVCVCVYVYKYTYIQMCTHARMQ
jgi:hypothetical protein